MTPQNDLINRPAIQALTRRELLSSAVGAALLVACSKDDEAAQESATRTINDHFGPVSIPADPKRIVTADVSTLSAVMNLGVTPVGSYFVGYAERPAYLGDLSRVQDITSGNSQIDLEKVLALKADLIITIVGTNNNVYLEER